MCVYVPSYVPYVNLITKTKPSNTVILYGDHGLGSENRAVVIVII
jgi:hypothetical protein